MTQEASSKRVALFGAGYTVGRVAARYANSDMVLVSRSAERVAELRARGYCVEQVDCSELASVQDFFRRYNSLETVVDSIPPRASGSDGATAGVMNIIAGVKGGGSTVKRIIYLSTSGVYGVEDGSWIDENRALNPQHERSRLRVESEMHYRESGYSVCCFRIAAIYGPGRGIGISLKSGRYPLIEGGMRWSNRIHVDDLAQAIILAIDYSQPLPEALNLVDDLPSLTSEVVDFYCTKFNLARPQPITLDQARERGMDTLLSNQRLSNQLLKRVLGMKFKFPSYREGAGSEFLIDQ